MLLIGKIEKKHLKKIRPLSGLWQETHTRTISHSNFLQPFTDKALLWIRIGFNVDSIPDPGSQTKIHADPDPGQTFTRKKYLKYQKLIGKEKKTFVKDRKSGSFIYFGQFLCYWIRICIPNTDQDT
jgi:hypothetical protein